MSKIFSALAASIKGSGKVQKLVRDAIVANDTSDVIACAVMIDDKFPVKAIEILGGDGKTRKGDANADERNDYLRNLRMALMRAGRDVGFKLTIKKVEGAWLITSEALAAAASVAVDEDGEPVSAAPVAKPVAVDEGDALWSAVELVLANLNNAAVLTAIRDGLAKMAKSVKN